MFKYFSASTLKKIEHSFGEYQQFRTSKIFHAVTVCVNKDEMCYLSPELLELQKLQINRFTMDYLRAMSDHIITSKQALFNETNLGYTALKPSHDIENDLTAYCYKANLNRYINTGQIQGINKDIHIIIKNYNDIHQIQSHFPRLSSNPLINLHYYIPFKFSTQHLSSATQQLSEKSIISKQEVEKQIQSLFQQEFQQLQQKQLEKQTEQLNQLQLKYQSQKQKQQVKMEDNQLEELRQQQIQFIDNEFLEDQKQLQKTSQNSIMILEDNSQHIEQVIKRVQELQKQRSQNKIQQGSKKILIEIGWGSNKMYEDEYHSRMIDELIIILVNGDIEQRMIGRKFADMKNILKFHNLQHVSKLHQQKFGSDQVLFAKVVRFQQGMTINEQVDHTMLEYQHMFSHLFHKQSR